MKTHRRVGLAILLVTGVSRYLFAVPCDGVTVCESPSSNASTESGWSASASGVSGLKSLVSVGPTGNQVGSRYYFAAVSTDLGASVANGGLTNDFNGFSQIGSFTQNVQSTPSATVSGGVIQSLRGSQTYYFYAQACPAGTGANGAGCSAWNKIRTGTFSTAAYPNSVFSNPTPASDSTVNSITARTSVPGADQGQVSQIDLLVDDLDNTLTTAVLMGFVSGTSLYPIDDSLYSPGFRPNTRYRYRGYVTYPYGVNVPTGGRQTIGTFYTVPNVPGNYGTDGVVSFTHVTATVRFHNSDAAVTYANPIGTEFEIQFVPTSGPTVSVNPAATSVTGLSSEQFTVLGVGLQDGMNYTVRVRALNRGRASGWQNSAWVTLGSFTTVPWGLSLTIDSNSVGFTAADATVSVTDNSGLHHYYIQFSPLAQEAQTAWPVGLSSLYSKSGLTPNTLYQVQARLCEQPASTEYCSAFLPVSPVSFATDAHAPTGGTVSASGPTSLLVNWSDPSTNPVGSTYEVEYCTDSGFTLNCVSALVSKVAGAAQTTTINSVNPSTTYYVHVRTRNVGRPTWPDSAYVSVGSATTPDFTISFTQAATFTANSNGDGLGGAISALAAKNGSDAGLTYSWSLTAAGSGGGSFAPTTRSGDGTNNPKSSVVTVARADTYTITVRAQDAFGNFATSQVVVPIAQQLTGVSISPATLTVKLFTNATFTATATDQFGQSIAGLTNNDFSWSAAGAGAVQQSPGVFGTTAQGIGITITATRAGQTGNATLTISNLDVSGAKAYPVPFKLGQHSSILFEDIGQDATIRIFTLGGREIFTHHAIANDPYSWNVRNASGELLGSGVYLYRIQSPEGHKEGKIIVLK